MEQALESIVFAALDRIDAEVYLGEKRKVFDVFELVNLFYVIQT